MIIGKTPELHKLFDNIYIFSTVMLLFTFHFVTPAMNETEKNLEKYVWRTHEIYLTFLQEFLYERKFGCLFYFVED